MAKSIEELWSQSIICYSYSYDHVIELSCTRPVSQEIQLPHFTVSLYKIP